MKLTLDEKIMEYQEWVFTNGKTPPKNANIRFSDGSGMRNWAHNWRRYVRNFEKEHKDVPLPENLQKIQAMCEFIEASFDGKIQLSTKKTDMEVRIKEYMEATRKLGRRPIKKDQLTFKDGMNMVCWYSAMNQIYGKNDRIEDILEQPEESLHPFVRMKKKLCEEGYYKDQFWKLAHLTFEQKAKEYLEWVNLHKCKPTIEEKFSDGVLMDVWYKNQNVALRMESQKQMIPSSDRMKEIITFAYMENEILKVKDMVLIRKPRMTTEEKIKYFKEHKEDFYLNPNQFMFPDETSVKNWLFNHKEDVKDDINPSFHLSLESHILEYLEMAKQEGHKLNTRDSRRFSDHYVAASWLLREECRVRKERKNESVISNLRMGELYTLAFLDDYLYTLEHTPSDSHPVDTTDWVKKIKREV